MTRETALTWSWLNILTKKRYDAVLAHYGDMNTALQHVDEAFLQGLGCKQDTIYKVLNRLEEFDVAAYASALAKRNIQFIDITNEQYPKNLRSVEDPPVFLYFIGQAAALQQPSIALVGTRKMTPYGKRVTAECAQACVASGITTISGLASGIDTVVAEETLAAGGTTVAVLAHGLAEIYPKANQRLADRIVDAGGVVMTEFPLDQHPDKYTFPARNRIVAGISIATIVVEAPEGSGALITADIAHGYGRDVFAVPGHIYDQNYAGCHAILHSGQAKLLSSPRQALQDIGIVYSNTPKKSDYAPATAEETAVWTALSSMPQGVDELIDKTSLTAAHISATLTMMELQGVVQNIGKNQWVK